MAASRRQTRGVFGFLFTIESAKYSPIDLENKIMTFIANARKRLIEEPEAINKFHEGLLARKKEGFKDIKEEASYFFGQMKNFSLDKNRRGIEWNRLE